MNRKELLLSIHELNRFVDKPILTHNGIGPIKEKDLFDEIRVMADKCLDGTEYLTPKTLELLTKLKCGPGVDPKEKRDFVNPDPKVQNRTVERMWPPAKEEECRFSPIEELKEIKQNTPVLRWSGETMEHNLDNLEIKVLPKGRGQKHLVITDFLRWVLDNFEKDKYHECADVARLYCSQFNSGLNYIEKLTQRAFYWGSFWRDDIVVNKKLFMIKSKEK